MKIVVQRVSQASVVVEGKEIGSIEKGLLIFLGVTQSDGQTEIDWLCHKIANLRIFNDEKGVMNHSLIDVGGDVLLISQFTLMANTKKGHRPSYVKAAGPDLAIPLYKDFIKTLETTLGKKIATGEFGADMKVSLNNDGPVTIIIDTQNK